MAVRTAAFEWLASRAEVHGDVLPRPLLEAGFVYRGSRVRLVGPQGIFKPRILGVPLSITTTPNSPYGDTFQSDALLSYSYQGRDPEHRANRGLRAAMAHRLPLAYFFGTVPGRYVACWPVYVVDDHPHELRVSVALDDGAYVQASGEARGSGERLPFGARVPREFEGEAEMPRRRYVTTLARKRLHQRAFRDRVLAAYRTQCALCRFRHEELLDAAHIVGDAEEEGDPVVSNGLALCKLHHGAFDRHFLGVRPDLVVQVRPDLLDERDGPTLVHLIQGLHGKEIWTPRRRADQPDPVLLARRYEKFEAAAAG